MALFEAGVDTIISLLPQENIESVVNPEQLLYLYVKNGTINGTPVRALDIGVGGITSLHQLILAMDVKGLIKVWSGYLSPLYKLQLALYQTIIQAIHDNKAQLIDLQKQYSAGKDAFLVVLTYADLHYELNNRYNFLRTQE